MSKGRIEAFSDGVIAIIITIMVLELRPPSGADPAALRPVLPALLAYLLSFVYVGIYWNNHHHMFQAARRVSGTTLWANLHLLFWLSLVPFVTTWMGGSHFGAWPVAAYGAVLLMNAVAWSILRAVLVRHHGPQSPLSKALRHDGKERASLVLYLTAIAAAFFNTWVSRVLFCVVAALWFIPDRRIEREVDGAGE